MTVYRDTRSDEVLGMVFTINGEETYELGHRMGMSHCSDPVQIDVGGNYVFKLGSGCAIVLEAQ